MSFHSIDYLIFYPIVVLLYFVFPIKIRIYWLLVSSYYFYMSWNAKYGLLLLFSTVITYLCGLLLEIVKQHFEQEKQRVFKNIIIFSSLLINFGILFYFKYTNFAINNISKVMNRAGISVSFPAFEIALPVGISFFIFQAVGYTIDVWRNDITAERNFFRYALFVSFFPQLVAGPIERSKNLLFQLRNTPKFDVEHAKDGLLIISYGLFMKLVVADNISAVVDPIFHDPDTHSGMAMLFATILFAFQIYCDFNGYTQIAIGSARILGLKLNENFNAPYMAVSVKDFWRRWHISLTSWFRDYLYIPLGGSRKGKFRKYINTMIVFICSGLWHGAAWHYVAWGGLNGLFSVLEDMKLDWMERVHQKLNLNKNLFMYKVCQRIITFVLIDFTWLFFRAPRFMAALHILKKILLDIRFAWLLNFDFVPLFGTSYGLMVVVVSLFIVIGIDTLKYYGVDIKKIIFQQQIVFRWIIYSFILLVILYWGHYGTGYEQTQFIYFQF